MYKIICKNKFWIPIIFFLINLTTFGQVISGSITNSQGDQMSYATIYLAQNGTSISADYQGNYRMKYQLSNMNRVDTLVISYIGYFYKKIPVYLDGKNKKNNSIRMVPYKFSKNYRNQIKLLVNELNINTGSIDFICAKNNQLYFLEINPFGQFANVSENCNYHIEKKIAQLLINEK